MTRLCVALITAFYAIAFAFLAIMAVRWPSALALATLVSDGTSSSADVGSLINWRQLGLFYGGLYLLAAICFYACSTLIQRKARGAFTSFVLGTVLGFPFLTLFDFSAGWWQAPNQFEQMVIGAAALALVLMPIINALTPKKQRTAQEPAAALRQTAPIHVHAPLAAQRPPRRRKPVPAAIARQRESFAAHGRRALAKKNR